VREDETHSLHLKSRSRGERGTGRRQSGTPRATGSGSAVDVQTGFAQDEPEMRAQNIRLHTIAHRASAMSKV